MSTNRVTNRSKGKMTKQEADYLRRLNYEWWASKQKNPPPMEEITNER